MDDEYLRDILMEAAYLAGDIQRKYFEKRENIAVEQKYGKTNESADLLSKADIETDNVLKEFFRQKLPEFGYIGEENGADYQGQDGIVVVDPLDGTKHFLEGRYRFGPIVGIYLKGKNIAGMMYNVMADLLYLGTEKTGFEEITSEDSIPVEKIDALHTFSIRGSRIEEDRAESIFETLTRTKHSCSTFRAGVCKGYYSLYMHPALAWHDIAAMPIFGRLTGTKVTNHLGESYDKVWDIEKEVDKYDTGEKERIYSFPIIVCKEEYFEKSLDVWQPYRQELGKNY